MRLRIVTARANHPWLAALGLAAVLGCNASEPAATVSDNSPDTPVPTSGLGPENTPTGGGGPQGPGSSGVAGTWYLFDSGAPMTLKLQCAQGAGCGGAMTDPATGASFPIDDVRWNGKSGDLRFRYTGPDVLRWYHTRIVEGVLTGRFAVTDLGLIEPTNPTFFMNHVTGWKSEYFDRALSPRVYDLVLDFQVHARLRIDRSAARDGTYEARFKVYADESVGAAAEEPEYDAAVTAWDGTTLAFNYSAADGVHSFTGTVSGRTVSGHFAVGTVATHVFAGYRAEVLSHGFTGQSPSERVFWQGRMRRQLEHIMMADAPAPLAATVTEVQTNLMPFAPQTGLFDRDDGYATVHPAGYTLTELAFEIQLPDPNGGSPIVRNAHGYYAVPNGDPPASGYPAVVAINGHTGSAAQVMTPDSEYFWYGDAYAMHGYAVLSIDIGHRPVQDRHGLYDGSVWGDDPANGNGTHPSIKSPGLDSDWEEDGERTWDVMRGIDWLLQRPEIDKSRVIASGLSLGGEITTFLAALDTRVTMAIPAGFSPDLSVLFWRGSHGCWKWTYGDIREYLDPSDLHALIAPRPMVVETGRVDFVYSELGTPYAGDKQVMRRSRPDWSDAPGKVLHYLHYDIHHFHFGAPNLVKDTEPNVRPPLYIAPASVGDINWQDDYTTIDTGIDLFATITQMLAP